jgi:Fe-S-cluster-containing hydrogenase component 2
MEGVINTIKQNCRRCYTCVRDCPAKAIRIEDGQASVVAERCISCGNCTMVCSQGAKAYKSGVENVFTLLDSSITAALVAPSFPVGFAIPPAQVIGALRQLGFAYVVEVAYGADLVNQACK